MRMAAEPMRPRDPGRGGGDGRGDRTRLRRDLPVREAQDAVAGPGQLGVAAAVALEGGTVAVEVPPVGLDDEPLAREEEVDLDRPDMDVGGRLRESVGRTQREEALLEVAAGEGRARVVLEPRRAGWPGCARAIASSAR
jgi:hypothetical protein